MAFKHQLLFLLLAVLPLCRANEDADGELDPSKPERFLPGSYSYGDDDKGPMNWGGLKPEYSACSDGRHQSPINVVVDSSSPPEVAKPDIDMDRSVIDFKAGALNFQFDCHAEFGNCSSVTFNGTMYTMLQVHGHIASEHHLGGQAYPLELHFVHKSADNRLLVFGIFFELGDDTNEELQTIIDSAQNMDTKVADLSKFFDEESTICTYDGSLTTPPCSEGVRWLLSTKPFKASLKQIGTFYEFLGDSKNNRPLQPITDRTVKCWPAKVASNGLLGKILN